MWSAPELGLTLPGLLIVCGDTEHMTVLTVAPLLAETIMNVFADDSVSAIFGGENQLF